MFLARSFYLGGFIFSCYYLVYRPNYSITPAKSRRFDERPAPSNIATEHLVRWNRPTRTDFEYRPQPRQCSVRTLHQLVHHIFCGPHRGVGKQWILQYTRVSTWGNVIDRGKQHQVKLEGLQRWKLHVVMEGLSVVLQFALLLFGVGLAVYTWDLDPPAAEVGLFIICAGLASYIFFTVAGTIWKDFPFKTPYSTLLLTALPWAKGFTKLARVSLRQRTTALVHWVERVKRGLSMKFLEHMTESCTGSTIAQNCTDEYRPDNDHYMTLSNPALWRPDPLFTSPIQEDISTSAGFWLLENSTGFSAANAVAAVFAEFQWPPHRNSTTALIRFRDTYTECFRGPNFDDPARLKALQSAAAYYILYHTQLIWNTLTIIKIPYFPPDLLPPLHPNHFPPDLFLHEHSEEWNEDGVFKYLLRIEDRSESTTSARFLSYIAPFWFCGNSDSAIKFRPSRLQTLHELIGVLERSGTLIPATLTDCVLCVGAAVDFPLHPEDLTRVDKRCVHSPVFAI